MLSHSLQTTVHIFYRYLSRISIFIKSNTKKPNKISRDIHLFSKSKYSKLLLKIGHQFQDGSYIQSYAHIYIYMCIYQWYLACIACIVWRKTRRAVDKDAINRANNKKQRVTRPLVNSVQEYDTIIIFFPRGARDQISTAATLGISALESVLWNSIVAGLGRNANSVFRIYDIGSIIRFPSDLAMPADAATSWHLCALGHCDKLRYSFAENLYRV